jgi:3-phosphoglycerate kinase
MNYSSIYKNYKNTIFYLLLGIFMIIVLSQFGYIKNSFTEGFDLTSVTNQINTIKSETNQLIKDTEEINNLTKTINDETERIRQNVVKLKEDTRILDSDKTKIEKETADLTAQYAANYQSQTG